VRLLSANGVAIVADVRKIRASRAFPHFGEARLSRALEKAGIRYEPVLELAGRRPKSPQPQERPCFRNTGFRNYADYMLTDEFRAGVEKLLEVAGQKRTAIMCAEGLFWQCHRRLVSDLLVANGVTVEHIMPSGELRPHTLTKGAVVEGERVTYPGERSLFG